ncbi:MAG: hypothetical protein HZA16_13140 [Nitrospirae bacterium]|nr:hypothetical protein [Nitrospirota bacterium]
MKRSVVLFAVGILLFSAIAYADEAGYQKHVAKGVLGLEKGGYSDAEAEFRSALKEKPGDRVATLYLGIALSRLNDKRAETVLLEALSYDPHEARTNLELGIHYFNRGEYDAAEDYFENAIKYAPDTEYSEKAEKYLRAAEKTGVPRKWALGISLGEQYDSNVVLGPENGELSANISRKSDWRTVFYVKGKYDIFKNQKADAVAGYSFYQSLHNRLNEFNVTHHILELKGSYRISPALTLNGSSSAEYAYVDNNDYEYALSVSPSLVVSEGTGLSTEIEYGYKRTHFMNSDFFTDNSDRTGRDNSVGITQNVPLNDFISAKAGYFYNEDRTATTLWDYRGNRVFTELRFRFPAAVYAGLNGEYYSKKYKDSASATGDDRKDRIYTASVSASKIFMERYSVTAAQHYIKDDSNTEAFAYKRRVTSLFLNVRF